MRRISDGLLRRHRHDLVCVVLLIAMTLASCLPLLTKYPSPGGDEPGFVDIAVTLMNQGVLGTPAYRGLLPGAEAHIYWQPPLYFVGLAGWFKLLGAGLTQARAFSLLWSLASVVLVYLIARREVRRWPSVVAAGLLAVSFWLTNRASVARMDAMCIALTLAAVLSYSLARERGRGGWYGLSGFVAGLALITHPLGIVAIAALSLHFLFCERIGALRSLHGVILLVGFGVVAGAWATFIAQDVNAFHEQMGRQLARKAQLGSYWYQFWMAKTHVVTFLVTCASGLWLVWASRTVGRGGIVAVAFACAFTAATFGREIGYFSYFYPLACCALAILLETAGRWRLVICGGVVLAFANELVILGHDISRYRHRDHGELARIVRDVIPPGKMVFLGPAEVAPYFALLGRNPMRIAVPISTSEPEAHRKVAESCDFIAVTPPVTYLPDLWRMLEGKTPVVTIDQGPGYRLAIYASSRPTQ